MPSATAMVRNARSKKREITPMRHANNAKQSVPATPRLRLPRWPTTWSAESSNLSPYVPGGVGHGGAMSRVRLVGVGPGHPGLATVQAVEAVKEADVIRNYDGCGTGLLHLAPSNADIAPLDSVDEVIRLARSGRKVTVLFPGNPYAFSNGSEVADRLERAGIDFEAVPGLIVELAAPVMSGIPLTIEGLSASIGFGLVTGGETVVLRLASGWWESGISALLQNGRQPETPAALILNPGQPGQHCVSAPLGNSKRCAIGQETADALAGHGLRPELVTSEYTAEGLANALEGWEMKGMRVLVPRAEVARDALPSLLANRGAEVEILPVYSAVCPAEATPALLRLFDGDGVDVITFTSSSTVVNFVQAFPEDRLPAILGDAEIACMVPVTADSARKLGLEVSIVAREYTTHGLVQAISEATARK